MLHHLKLSDYADRIHNAVLSTISEGQYLTSDLGGKSTTSDYTKALIDHLWELNYPSFPRAWLARWSGVSVLSNAIDFQEPPPPKSSSQYCQCKASCSFMNKKTPPDGAGPGLFSCEMKTAFSLGTCLYLAFHFWGTTAEGTVLGNTGMCFWRRCFILSALWNSFPYFVTKNKRIESCFVSLASQWCYVAGLLSTSWQCGACLWFILSEMERFVSKS